MIELPTVDLLVTEGVHSRKAIQPTLHTLRFIKFRRVLLFSPELPEELRNHVTHYTTVRWNYEQWNRFMVVELAQHVTNGHVLNIHFDGYVLNPAAWDDAWLQYDYIGSPWWYQEGMNVGNGGFSLRSKKYLEATALLPLERYAPEDHLCIRESGERLQSEFGIKFAPEEVARRFGLEANPKCGTKWDGQFGFHNDRITDISLAFSQKFLHQM